MEKKRLLILEDDIKVLVALLAGFRWLHAHPPAPKFALTIISEYEEFQDYLDSRKINKFNYVLIDADGVLGRKILNQELPKATLDLMVAFSNDSNEKIRLLELGINRIIETDRSNPNNFPLDVADNMARLVEGKEITNRPIK